MMLTLKMLRRHLKGGELKLLAVAIMLAVTVVSGVAVFTERLQRSLVQESSMLLGADKLLQSSSPIRDEWLVEAESYPIKTAQVVQFGSMVYAGDHMHLASVRAVGPGYPLRGEVVISETPFATADDQLTNAQAIPAEGEVWVDSRLLPLLNISLGGELAIGEASFRATRVVIRQPDASNPFSFMGAGLMMNLADLEKTRVVQPGSRVQYQWLFAGSDSSLSEFTEWLSPLLSPHEKLKDIASEQNGPGNALEMGEQFLLFAAVIGVLLAGVAIALAARQFTAVHVDQVALLKSLGASAGRVRRLYLGECLVLAVMASLAGLLAGHILQHFVARAIVGMYQLELAPVAVFPYVISFCAGLLSLVCFALPALWPLPAVSPLKILRRELKVTVTGGLVQAGFALLAIVILVLIFSRSWVLAASVLCALIGVLLLAVALALGLLKLCAKLGAGAGSVTRLAVAGLLRGRAQTALQMVVFAVAIMLLITLAIVRTSLIDEWQMQVPDDAPNHFILNVPAYELTAVQNLLDQQNIKREPLYPMVRGRLTGVNNQPITDEQRKTRGVFNREANLTWAQSLGGDNKIVAGRWWDSWQGNTGLPGVSVEQELAQEAGLELGDTLTFSVGGLTLQAEVASLRSLDWRSMKPNFFFIFEPGALAEYSPTYMTSFYLAPDNKIFLNTVLQKHPTALVIELDRIISQIRAIVTQVSNGIMLVLVLVLAGGCLVLLSAVKSSVQARRQEAGLLRALGSPRRRILGAIWLEYALLGLVAGIMAVLGAELLLLNLQYWVFDTPIQPHVFYWFAGPLISSLFIGALGWLSCRHAVNTPPAVVLREA